MEPASALLLNVGSSFGGQVEQSRNPLHGSDSHVRCASRVPPVGIGAPALGNVGARSFVALSVPARLPPRVISSWPPPGSSLNRAANGESVIPETRTATTQIPTALGAATVLHRRSPHLPFSLASCKTASLSSACCALRSSVQSAMSSACCCCSCRPTPGVSGGRTDICCDALTLDLLPHDASSAPGVAGGRTDDCCNALTLDLPPHDTASASGVSGGRADDWCDALALGILPHDATSAPGVSEESTDNCCNALTLDLPPHDASSASGVSGGRTDDFCDALALDLLPHDAARASGTTAALQAFSEERVLVHSFAEFLPPAGFSLIKIGFGV